MWNMAIYTYSVFLQDQSAKPQYKAAAKSALLSAQAHAKTNDTKKH